MTRPYQNAYPVTFFGKMLTFSRIKLATTDFDVIAAHLAEVSPNKDSQIPIIIDTDVEIDLKKLIDLLWEWGLQPIGITRGVLDEQAKTMRMPIFPADGKRMQRVAAQSRETSAPKAEVAITPMQERFAKQIQELKYPSVENDPVHSEATEHDLTHNDIDYNDTGHNDTIHNNISDNNTLKVTKTNPQNDDSASNSNNEANDNLKEDKKDNPPPEIQKPRQGYFSSAAFKDEDDNPASTQNSTHDVSHSELTASESKKNRAIKSQQSESAERAFTGTRTASPTKPTTSQTIINKSQVFIEEPQAIDHITSKVYDQMLRSGQSVKHVGGDLILTNSVNDGAETITDNNLHIYGKGMGKLVAGATGDPDAKIFCQQFNPSLVSVAGTYMLRDSLPPEVINKAVQVSYKNNEGLVFRVMDDWSQTIAKNTTSD